MTETKNKNQGSKMQQPSLTKFQEYFYANLLWWGFLVLLAVISYFTCGAVWDDVTSGVMEFIFIILGGGFVLTSLLVFTYETYFADSQQEVKK